MNIIESIFEFLFQKPINFIRLYFKQLIIAYLIGFLPAGYALTAATTQLDITDPTNTSKGFIQSGPINIISAGTFKPTLSLGQNMLGGTKEIIGDAIGSTQMVKNGQNLQNKAMAWTQLGAENQKKIIDYKDKQTQLAKDKAHQAGKIVVNSIGTKSNQAKKKVNQSANQTKNNTKTTVSNKGSEFKYAMYPDYYRVIGLANVNPKEFPGFKTEKGHKKGIIKYSKLDSLGRTREAIATINWQNVEDSRGIRQSFKAGSEPSGWGHNEKAAIPGKNGRVYNGYMYNRSHLIGDAIGGDAIKQNAITGTRPQNVGNVDQKGGMRYLEKKVEDYFKNKTDKVVYYKVTPKYQGKELLPRSVIVYAMSSDKKINEKVEVYNTANGWDIDYNTGKFQKSK